MAVAGDLDKNYSLRKRSFKKILDLFEDAILPLLDKIDDTKASLFEGPL